MNTESNSTPSPEDGHGTGDGRPGGSPGGGAFFTWLRDLGIVRGDERWFAGVAGGIAGKAGIDPLIVRGAFVVLALLGGPGILLYLVGWLLLPDRSGRIHVEEIIRGRASTGIVVAAVVLTAVIIVPAIFGVVVSGAPAFGLWGWDLWGSLGVPGWVTATAAWLFWIAVLVVGFVWLRSVVLDRGRDAARERAEAGSAGGAAAGEGVGAADAAGAPAAAWTSGPEGTERRGDPAQGPAGAADGRARSFAEQADAAAQRVGEWGERAGQAAGEWGERVGKQADDWSARYAEHHEAHRLGAGHTILTLAFALLAAGAAALWGMGLSEPLPAMSAVPAPLIAALIAALAVLALSLVIAGVRGRHTGWIGFLSACGVVALLVTAVLPWGTRFVPFGTVPVSAAHDAPGAAVLAGNVTVDLAEPDVASAAGDEELAVWLLAGNVTVEVPEAQPAVIEVRVLAGNVKEEDAADERMRTSGPFIHRTIRANLPASGSTADAARVSVTLVAGNVKVRGTADTANGAGIRDDSAAGAAERRALAAEQAALQEELDRIAWELEEPGLDRDARQDLRNARDELRDDLATIAEEMAR
ncbi:PspC domain-containing protein [Leucobacter allii]|uniref:PspC domain-containing protein n=1 Tax=Leucobacter allii TaxID=2932247 RepID=UPI001FD09ACD|nr:PspC domain-containing protein [Leucobacter allii]UOR00921.1 PspC domain-containing protein [Leucobacter allii]